MMGLRQGRRVGRFTGGDITLRALLFVFAAISLIPLYWMISGSFKLETVTIDIPPQFFPLNPTLQNWRNLLDGFWPVWLWLVNSLAVSALTCVLVVVVSSMAGYAFGTKRFPGSRALFFVLLATMFLPAQVMLIPLFLWVRDLRLERSLIGLYFAMAMPLIASPFGIFLVKQFASTIPRSIVEAGIIDGASERHVFTHIILPILKPVLAALSIFTFNTAWNYFMWQMVLANGKETYTIPVGVSYIALTPAAGRAVTDYGLMMAGGTFGAFFMIVFFVVFQRYFVKGITIGAVKG